MVAYVSLDEIPVGFAGDLSRVQGNLVEPAQFAQNIDVEPGKAVYYNANGKADYFTGEEGQTVIGLVTRTYPAGSGYPESTKIPAGRIIGIMRRGHMLVKCVTGTPAQGGKVYMYKANDDSGSTYKIGDFSASEVATKTVEIPGATWGSTGVSADGLAEVAVI